MSMDGLESKARGSGLRGVIGHLFDGFKLKCRVIVLKETYAVILIFTLCNGHEYMVRLIS